MPYYRKCPVCGAALDPGEICDCQDEETAPRAANSEGCQVDHELSDPRSASILSKKQEDFKYESGRTERPVGTGS